MCWRIKKYILTYKNENSKSNEKLKDKLKDKHIKYLGGNKEIYHAIQEESVNYIV